MNKSKSLHSFFVFFCTVLLFSTKMQGQCNPTSDSLELVKLYDATNGDNWTDKTNWKVVGMPIGTWYGVRLNTGGCVDSIGLINNNLSGTIPNLNLPNLRILYLYNNKLTEMIPDFDLPKLENLQLNTNQLNGSIPNLNLPSLKSLALTNNNLTGTIPNFNLPNLQFLYLGYNSLTGTIPNFNLPNLQVIDIERNQLTGSIPDFNLSNLQYIYLDRNQLTGSIPNFNLPNLKQIGLNQNQLTGNVPNFNLPNLQYIYLGFNLLTGTIPNFNLPILVSLQLHNNQLSGSIPSINTPKLQQLMINNNNLNSIPDLTYIQTWRSEGNLAVLFLKNNHFTFKDILPNMPILNAWSNQSSYVPQDSIYRDTIIAIQSANDLTIDLNIDGAITNNNYKWFKNGIFLKDTNRNKLILRGVKPTDAGVYTCQVTNPGAPDLTLNTRNITVTVFSQCRAQDSLVLMDLYRATNGANWTNKWDTTKPIDTWFGVSLNADGCVTCIDLDGENNCSVINNSTRGNNLVGILPNLKIDNLKSLILTNNQLSGTIPNLNLPNLEKLSLFGNKLIGNIPNFNMPNLQFLDISYNQLSGSIPNFNMPNLQFLEISSNKLSGSIPNFNMSNLNVLWLPSNQLSGSIPNFNMPNLFSFDLQGNQLSDSIPNFNMRNLQYFNLANNQLSGTIPNLNMPNLQRLYLQNNQLSSSIPNFNMPNLQYFNPANNQLSGTIPNFNLPNLQYLYLHSNQLSGIIPNFNLPNLTDFWIYKNKYTFENILSPIQQGTKTSVSFNQYFPQDTIYKDTTINIQATNDLTIDLNIDGTITNNNYKWFKNGTFLKDTNRNKLILRGVKPTDAGVYTCQVTNPDAPSLTLYTRNITVTVFSQCRAQDSLVLMDLYRATNGANWTNKWDTTKPIDTWYGVSLNADGCVICIDLDGRNDCSSSGINTGNNLVGTLPNLKIESLEGLYLANNKINGNIPILSMPNLTNLTLHDNQLKDTIPISLGNLSKLVELDMGRNQLSGVIPNSLGNLSNIILLDLSSNQLKDTIPSSLGNLSNLVIFSLNNNRLTGKIPISFQNLMQLRNFWFDSNKIDSCPNLSLLPIVGGSMSKNKLTFDNILPNISRNQIFYAPQDSIYKDTTISIPLTKTLTIDLNIDGTITNSNYKWFKNGIFLKDTNRNKLILRGVTPTDAGVYTCQVTNPDAPLLTLYTRNITVKVLTCREQDSLVLMDLYRATNGANWTNKWDTTKPIDTWFGVSLTTQGCVERVFLPNNGLIGTIPNLDLPNLIQLTLSRNQLKESIPNFNLPKLVGLALSDNKLNGNIPNFNLPELQTLSLFSNELSDTIPNFNLPKLQSLLLNDNKLSGRIPNFNLPNLQVLWLYLNQLSGTIPNFNLLTKLEQLALSNNQLSGTIPDFSFTVLKSLHLNNNKLTGCFPNTLKIHCVLGFNTTIGQNGYNFTNNPALPWSGDFTLFCNNNNQIRASCNDGNAATQKDIITASCTCAGRICISIEAIDDKVIIKDNETITEFTTTSNDRFDAGAQITATVLKKPQFGQLDSLGLGKFRYEMLPTLRGSIQNFTYRICDTACLNLCDTAQVSIEIQGLSPVIKSSKGITPYNQDGKNDVLEFDEIEDPSRYPNNELIIYNRWNSIIYRAQPYLNNWGGINLQGQQLPTGTYYYILHLDKKANLTLTGDVVIIR